MKITTEYKNVYQVPRRPGKLNEVMYRYSKLIKGDLIKSQSMAFKTAKECAMALDKKLIEKGFEPINVLKRN